MYSLRGFFEGAFTPAFASFFTTTFASAFLHLRCRLIISIFVNTILLIQYVLYKSSKYCHFSTSQKTLNFFILFLLVLTFFHSLDMVALAWKTVEPFSSLFLLFYTLSSLAKHEVSLEIHFKGLEHLEWFFIELVSSSSPLLMNSQIAMRKFLCRFMTFIVYIEPSSCIDIQCVLLFPWSLRLMKKLDLKSHHHFNHVPFI